MAAHGKGTVTSLSSMFPAEEARKAAERMQEIIAEKDKELDNLHHFVDDNTNLINQVRRLPDELHHNIMVPFGKHAFFPGRLVHTNELLVLLGDGYFAERTAKQTVDILKRRGKTLESQVDSLKAVIEDLKIEASFFDRTASEAAEGLVEIREELTDDDKDSEESKANPNPFIVSKEDSVTGTVDDEEYARIMSRLDELEKEELEAENTEEHDDGNHEDLNKSDLECSNGPSYGSRELSGIPLVDMVANTNLGSKSLQLGHRDKSSFDKDFRRTHVEKSTVKDNVPSVMKTNVQPEFKSNSEISFPKSEPAAGSLMSRSVSDSLKAFTGSIVERTDNLQISSNKGASRQSSKPVSRFKMQRRAT